MSEAAIEHPAAPTARLLTNDRQYWHIDLRAAFGDDLPCLPWLMRILAENALRNSQGEEARTIVAAIRAWLAHRRSDAEIAFQPERVMMHDTTCIPALVDIAAMRDALAACGHDPAALSPILPVDVAVDHSVAVDSFGTPDALALNMERELARNAERYRMMKWASRALSGFRVHPPGTGIMHTLNLEQLASVIAETRIGDAPWLVPDTLIGTDSHTPMVNGIGVLAWGVGGLEAESVMFGMPVMLRLPDVVGVRLIGSLREGALATDLALAVTELLRSRDLDGAFVEFFGPGVSSLTGSERAVVANMAPEYGAGTGYFAIDEQTLAYLRATGRDEAALTRIGVAARAMGLWFDPDAAPRYTDTLELDISEIGPSIAGPRRPQDRLAPSEAPRALAEAFRPLRRRQENAIPDGAVAIAAITSCTNTSDPRLIVAAGLLARNARRAGLRPPNWVKTSLAPGSPAAARYLKRAGLAEDLAAIGFGVVGFGCTTCIGNSGSLVPAMSAAIADGTLGVAVLSGNRNFPGRVHPDLEAGFLASPPLVVAYALAGDVNRDILDEPIGTGHGGASVRLADLWPSETEIEAAVSASADPEDVREAFAQASRSAAWEELQALEGPRFPWDPFSAYLQPPPFARNPPACRLGCYSAFPLLVLGDDVTTDHISPAGQIQPDSEAGRYLVALGSSPGDLNVYAARRGNWNVMVRGLFDNRTVRNLLDERCPPGWTIHAPSGEIWPISVVAARHTAEHEPLVIIAGERFGMGSSRDWAAKGQALLGVRAVLAQGFERIHRSNLIGMGILPLRLPSEAGPAELGLKPGDRIELNVPAAALTPRANVNVTIAYADGRRLALLCRAEVGTALEIEQLRAGGVIPLIIRDCLGRVGGVLDT